MLAGSISCMMGNGQDRGNDYCKKGELDTNAALPCMALKKEFTKKNC